MSSCKPYNLTHPRMWVSGVLRFLRTLLHNFCIVVAKQPHDLIAQVEAMITVSKCLDGRMIVLTHFVGENDHAPIK